jgi:hypothetical protein
MSLAGPRACTAGHREAGYCHALAVIAATRRLLRGDFDETIAGQSMKEFLPATGFDAILRR